MGAGNACCGDTQHLAAYKMVASYDPASGRSHPKKGIRASAHGKPWFSYLTQYLKPQGVISYINNVGTNMRKYQLSKECWLISTLNCLHCCATSGQSDNRQIITQCYHST